jgi:hypothetical protein
MGAPAHAQESRIPTKDVAVLVDVSKSVVEGESPNSEAKAMGSARMLIQELAEGGGFTRNLFPDWDLDLSDSSPEMLELFGQYFEAREGKFAPTALIAPDQSFYVAHIGNLSTVLEGVASMQIKDESDIGWLLNQSRVYPRRVQEFPDTSTCYWYAMARTADALTSSSPNGYYLFVVSDEDDDPDYLPGADNGDYEKYLKKLSARHSIQAIESKIRLYFDGGGRQYLARADHFSMTVIARFQHRNNSKVVLTWYGMGVKPAPLPEKKEEPAIVEKKELVPPAFKPGIMLLGGLSERDTKTYFYGKPLIVWQIPYAEASRTGLNTEDFEVLVDRQRVNFALNKKLQSSRSRGPFTAQLSHLKPGREYKVKVRQKGDSGRELESSEVSIIVRPWDYRIFAVLAATAGVAALAIFIWTWFSLRPKVMASA